MYVCVLSTFSNIFSETTGPIQTSAHTKMNFNENQKKGRRKGRVGYDMNNPNESMYVLVCMYVGR